MGDQGVRPTIAIGAFGCHGTSASSFGPVSSPIPHDRAQAGKLPDIKSRGGFMMPVQKLLEIARTEVSGGSTTCVK